MSLSLVLPAPASCATLLVVWAFAAAFTLVRNKGPDDTHRCRKRGSRVFAEVSRQKGILAPHPPGARPGGDRLFQDLLPCLPIHVCLSPTPPQTLRRQQS